MWCRIARTCVLDLMWTIEIDSIARENTGFMVEVDFKYQFAEYIIFKQDGILGCE